jgi:hypothetical protein
MRKFDACQNNEISILQNKTFNISLHSVMTKMRKKFSNKIQSFQRKFIESLNVKIFILLYTKKKVDIFS